jgi:hypothetical protein
VFEGFDEDARPHAVPLSMKESQLNHQLQGILFAEASLLGGAQSERARVRHDPAGNKHRHHLQDAYEMVVTAGNRQDPDILPVRCAWEDNATKLQANTDDAAPGAMLLDKLDDILQGCANVQMTVVSTWTPTRRGVHWERQPSNPGCTKMYRGRSWNLDLRLL